MKTAEKSFTSPGRKRPGIARGFTLIELMVVVAVVAILVAIAVPSYSDAVRKSKRGQAKADLVELAQRAERFRTINGKYDGFWDNVSTSDRNSPRTGDVAYQVTEVETDTTFTLTATPQGGQANDTRCMTLTLDQAGVKTESGTGTVADCW